MSAETEPPYFVDGNHAFRAGEVLGVLLKHQLSVAPEVDDVGNYTDVMTLTYPGQGPIEQVEVRIRVLPGSLVSRRLEGL